MRISSNSTHAHAVRRRQEHGGGNRSPRAGAWALRRWAFPSTPDTEIPVDWNAYIAEIDRLKAACGDRLRIRTGIELDRLSDVNPSPFEYYIAANH